MKRYIYILGFFILAFGCKQPYQPKVISTSASYLVVEGAISTGQDSTVFRLSRTVPLSATTGSVPVLGAVVTVYNEVGYSYPLIETGNGFYKAPGINLNSTHKYSLKIIVPGDKVYQSDFVDAKNSPPIDSVYYRIKGNGLEVYADTHDPSNNTRYYRWDFNDTYIFHSAFEAFDYFTSTPVDTVLNLPVAQQTYTCWRSDTSTTILLNSSAKLTSDIISENPITFISSTSEKIASRYSILVKQYALTPDAYNYFEQLKKNTEQLGSIFDAQPSELPGNIHCVSNPSEPVLGYITAGASSESRIFIDNRNLPAWVSDNSYAGCVMDTDLFIKPVGCCSFTNDVKNYIYTRIESPIYTLVPPGSSKIIGYTASNIGCIDCTLRGTNKQPSFWTTQ